LVYEQSFDSLAISYDAIVLVGTIDIDDDGSVFGVCKLDV
jgi:hypothetical protein